METQVKTYYLDNSQKIVHMLGDTVAVCWNTTTVPREIVGADGLTYRTSVPTTRGKPYIDFIWLREDQDGSYYEDEDSPVEGGFSADYARKLIAELQWAVEYLGEQV